MTHQTQTDSSIRKFLQSELSFYVTVGVALAAFAANYFGIMNQLSLLNQKVEYKAEQQLKMEVNLESLQSLVISLDKRITALENRIIK